MSLPAQIRRRTAAASVLARTRRARTLALLDPASGLFRTHAFAVEDVIDTATVFPTPRTDEVTFATTIRRTDEVSTGLIFEIGSSTAGVAAAIDGNDLYFVAGANDASDAGATLFMPNALVGIGAIYRLVFALRSGNGMLACWINGQLGGAAQAVDETFVAWSDGEDGSFAAAVEGTVTDRIPVGLRTAPVDFEALAPLSVYRRQRPRHMPSGTVTIPPSSGGIFSFDSTLITFDTTLETFDEA